MGGHIGMLLAAEANTPIRRLVINDTGPFIPLIRLKRIGAYVGQSPVFDDLEGVEKHMREMYAPFGDLSDENWRHLARYGARTMAYNQLSLAWDPAIAQPILAVDQDVDLWSAYDRIRGPVLLLHGLVSDVLPTSIAQEMNQRGPLLRGRDVVSTVLTFGDCCGKQPVCKQASILWTAATAVCTSSH